MRPRSAPGESSLIIRLRFPCTTAVSGSGRHRPVRHAGHRMPPLGMNVVARTDPHAVATRSATLIPTGSRSTRRRADPPLGEPRPLGDLRARSVQLRVHGPGPPRDRDGLQSRRHLRESLGATGRRCFCVHCRQNFRTATGRELPRTTDARDPLRRQYLEWREARLIELWKRWDATVPSRPSRRPVHPERTTVDEDRRRSGGDPVR